METITADQIPEIGGLCITRKINQLVVIHVGDVEILVILKRIRTKKSASFVIIADPELVKITRGELHESALQ